MKKNIFIIVLIALCTIFSLNEVKAACPPWATNSGTYNFTVNGCVYVATVCWKCPITNGIAQVAIDNVKLDNPNCIPQPPITLGQIRRAILEQLSDPAWLYQFCTYAFPPCPSTSYEYKLYDYNCVYMYMNNRGVITYHTCDFNSWCEQTWSICFDAFGPHKYLVTDWTHQGATDCPTETPEMPDEIGEYPLVGR